MKSEVEDFGNYIKILDFNIFVEIVVDIRTQKKLDVHMDHQPSLFMPFCREMSRGNRVSNMKYS